MDGRTGKRCGGQRGRYGPTTCRRTSIAAPSAYPWSQEARSSTRVSAIPFRQWMRRRGKPFGSFQNTRSHRNQDWPKGPPSQSLLMGETAVWSVKDTTYGLHGYRKVSGKTRLSVLRIIVCLRYSAIADRSRRGHQHYKPSGSCDRSALGQDTLVARSRHDWNTRGTGGQSLGHRG